MIYAPSDLNYGTFRMLQTVISMSHKIAENLFAVVRPKEELENRLIEINA